MTDSASNLPASAAASSSPSAQSAPSSSSGPAPLSAGPPATSWIAVFMRLLAVQGSWNYELLLGPGIGFCLDPVLRRLPGGRNGEAYRAAMARESRYFNAHPYLASIAVGALARAELSNAAPGQIERFRTAVCGPLGSVGDRLVWARWLPFCALVGMLAFALGAGPLTVLLVFLLLYNVGHLALRIWGLRAGWRDGLRVASALGSPVLRQGPAYVARGAALVAGLALPSLLVRSVGTVPSTFALELASALAVGAILVRFHGRLEGWRAAIFALALLALYSIIR